MRRFLLILFSLTLLLTGCSSTNGYSSRDIYAMSTLISLNISDKTKDCEKLLSKAEEMIYNYEKTFSVTNSKSEISLFNQSKSAKKLSDDAICVINTALDVAKNTKGAYDPTCFYLTELWNISGGGYLPNEDEIEAALLKTDYTLLCTEENLLKKDSPDIKVDLGGVAKGYVLQKTVEFLSKDAEYGMISIGGNVGVWGEKPDSSKWEIGIRDPFNTNDVVGYFQITEGYVSVSGDYERFFEENGVRYHHIFDPKTGYPVTNTTHSVAVFTDDAALGDALSTALFVMGYRDAVKLYESKTYKFEALFVTDDGLFMTEGAKKIFTEK